METRNGDVRGTICLCLLAVVMGLAACSAGVMPSSTPPEEIAAPEPSGGLMLPPAPPGVWYGGDYVSLEKAAEKAPFVILLPDEAVVGAELVSVELNHPETVMGVALHYANGVVVDQQISTTKSLRKTLKSYEKIVEVNGVSAIGKEAGYSESQITGGKIPYPATIRWYVDGVSRYIRSDTLTMEELRQIAESMKPYEQ